MQRKLKMKKKSSYDIYNLKCTETNSLLSQYGFVEYYVSESGKKKDEERYLYLQLKPAIGLLVYNYCHKDKTGIKQGFDFFMYNTYSFEGAVFLKLHAKKLRPFMLHMYGIHEQLNRFESVMDRLIEEENSEFRVVMSKYETCFDKKAFYY